MSDPQPDPGAEDDERLAAYLAGTLPDDEAEAFEARLFEDPSIAARHELAEELRALAPPPPAPGPMAATSAGAGDDARHRARGVSVPPALALAASVLLAISGTLNGVLLVRGAGEPELRPAEVVSLMALRGGSADATVSADPQAGPLVLRLERGPLTEDDRPDVRLVGAEGRTLELRGAVIGEFFVDVVVDRAALTPGTWQIELRYDDGQVVRYELELR